MDDAFIGVITGVGDEIFRRGEQAFEHVAILPDNVHHQGVGILHEQLRHVAVVRAKPRLIRRRRAPCGSRRTHEKT